MRRAAPRARRRRAPTARGARRALARAFVAWARVPESVPEAREASDRQTGRPVANDRAVINDGGLGGLPERGFPDRTEGKPRDGADDVSSARDRDMDRDPFYSPVSAPPPRLDRDVAAGLVDQIEHLKRRNDSLAVALRESRDALEASGPTPREAAQSEKFRAHLQRLQRELEATRLARDAARDWRSARRARRHARRRRGVLSLKAASTQTGGPGDLSRLDAADRDVAAERRRWSSGRKRRSSTSSLSGRRKSRRRRRRSCATSAACAPAPKRRTGGRWRARAKPRRGPRGGARRVGAPRARRARRDGRRRQYLVRIFLVGRARPPGGAFARVAAAHRGAPRRAGARGGALAPLGEGGREGEGVGSDRRAGGGASGVAAR